MTLNQQQRRHFDDLAREGYVGPGIYRVRIADSFGAHSGHTAATTVEDLAAGVAALWPHDTEPGSAMVEIDLVDPIPGAES